MQDLILYHDPGCGGDFLTNLLQSTGEFYSRCEFNAPDSKGKVSPNTTKPEVNVLFPDPVDEEGTNTWGRRQWHDWDEQKIRSLTDKTWILNVMRWQGIETLREKQCDWPILKISYNKNIEWFIKKCVLKKIARAPFWETFDDPMDSYMFDKGIFPQYFLKKHLRSSDSVHILSKGAEDHGWSKHPPEWEISVDSMLAKDFSTLADFDTSRLDQNIIDAWVSKQEPMFTKRPVLPAVIEKLFGYNSCLSAVDYACPLDDLDNILIKFHYTDAPSFNTSQELFNYF